MIQNNSFEYRLTMTLLVIGLFLAAYYVVYPTMTNYYKIRQDKETIDLIRFIEHNKAKPSNKYYET